MLAEARADARAVRLHGVYADEDAIAHAYAIREKYGDHHANFIEAPSGEMKARIARTSQAFDAVLQHVDLVDAQVRRQ